MRRRSANSVRAAVLLEVILALAIFVAAAAVVGMALNSSMEGVERQRIRLHSVNLALSAISELQMGIRAPLASGPAPFAPPFESWSFQIALTATEDEAGQTSGLSHVEVVIRHAPSGAVHRIAQVVQLKSGSRTQDRFAAEAAFESSQTGIP